jgi:hypothetical protein
LVKGNKDQYPLVLLNSNRQTAGWSIQTEQCLLPAPVQNIFMLENILTAAGFIFF